MKLKQLEVKNILIFEKNYKYLVIYFIRYVHSKLTKISSLRYNELVRKIEEHEVKEYLMVDDYMLGKILHNNRH